MALGEVEVGSGLVVTARVGAGVVPDAVVVGAVVEVQLLLKGALVSKNVAFDEQVTLFDVSKHGAGVSKYVAFGVGVDVVMTAGEVAEGEVEVGADVGLMGHEPQHGS